ncbi:MAG TPA: glycosyltransferase [Polyangiales bacterium]|nr:glycosyltransferase [Polyangiales bacterium]
MNAVAFVYAITAGLAALYASFEARFLWHFVRRRAQIRDARASEAPSGSVPIADALAPMLTIQIPLYNERTTANVAIRAAAAQDYPRDRLEVQVLDDSTDETSAIVASTVAELQAQGMRIEHVQRDHRSGFKAGALANGLTRSQAELVAIFDADFAPPPDFARRLILEVRAFDDPEVAFVQARWGFVNSDENLVTLAQTLLIDRHFCVQKPTWQHLGRVTMFNGSAGIWRRLAIDDSGGWSADTLTEDLDLSYRAAMRGWRGRYVASVVSDSELPAHLLAFKLQQRRWAHGCAQAMKKLGGSVARASGIRGRADELFVIGGYVVHPILLLNTLLWPWAVLYASPREVFLGAQVVVSLATLVGPVSFALSAREVGRPISWSFARDVAFATLLGMGLMVNNTIAHVTGYFSHEHTFDRTPKQSREPDVANYRLTLDWTLGAEFALLGYCVASATWLVRAGEIIWAPPCLVWALALSAMIGLQLAPVARHSVNRTS